MTLPVENRRQFHDLAAQPTSAADIEYSSHVSAPPTQVPAINDKGLPADPFRTVRQQEGNEVCHVSRLAYAKGILALQRRPLHCIHAIHELTHHVGVDHAGDNHVQSYVTGHQFGCSGTEKSLQSTFAGSIGSNAYRS